MVCLSNMCMATLNKGDNDSHNNINNNNNNNNNNKHLERQPSREEAVLMTKCGRDELSMACSWDLVCGRSDKVTVDCSGERVDKRFECLKPRNLFSVTMEYLGVT